MELRNVSGNGLKDISIKINKGEILGLGGLVGAGRTELAELIMGCGKIAKGQFGIQGRGNRYQ